MNLSYKSMKCDFSPKNRKFPKEQRSSKEIKISEGIWPVHGNSREKISDKQTCAFLPYLLAIPPFHNNPACCVQKCPWGDIDIRETLTTLEKLSL